MYNYLFETSKTISLLKILGKKYYSLDRRLDDFYKHSQLYRWIGVAFDNLKKGFKYSLVNRISEIREPGNLGLLNNSRIVEYSMYWLRTKKGSLVFYASFSKTVALIKKIVRGVCSSPVKAGSLILISAVIVNTALLFLLKREINLWGWLMRGIFLFAGISGLLSNADWLTIKDNSSTIRLIRKGAK